MLARRLAAMATVTTTLAATALLTPPTSASASVQVHTVFATQYNVRRVVSSVAAACPPGTELYGGGAQVVGGGGNVLITALEPRAGDYRATAEELGDPNGDPGTPWTLQTYAICGTGVTGVEHVAATQTLPTAGPLEVTAACPTGKVLVGTGASTDHPSVVLSAIRPTDAGRSLTVTAQHGIWTQWYEPLPADVALTSFAVCADTPAVWSIEVVGSQPRDADPQGKTADCGPGRVALGGGLTSFGGGFAGWHAIWGFFPHSAAAGAPPSRFTVRMGSPSPLGIPWANAAWAICAAI